MLFVHDYEPDIVKGSKECGPGSDDDVDIPCFCPLTLVKFLSRGHG